MGHAPRGFVIHPLKIAIPFFDNASFHWFLGNKNCKCIHLWSNFSFVFIRQKLPLQLWVVARNTCTICCDLKQFSWVFLEYFKIRKVIFLKTKKCGKCKHHWFIEVKIITEGNSLINSLCRRTKIAPNFKKLDILM